MIRSVHIWDCCSIFLGLRFLYPMIVWHVKEQPFLGFLFIYGEGNLWVPEVVWSLQEVNWPRNEG